ncbi:MAG: succinyl-CoA--3-ketoacid-CoA transferase [Deltaproteobacteria bacterium CG_4_9_14_3_um_filter_63_12]|nr:MAG: succinyl-CoA--3-ketoacid-CoA transferase [Deltaproteobacteria bacterium CG_4_9_14_3_um_filter_63_12]
MPFSQEEMAQKAALEIPPNSIVNLGIGLPTLVANYLLPDHGVWLHSENGILGMGPYPYEGEEDPQLINAGKQTVTIVPGGSTFDSALSFTMIRGGHVDLVLLGAMQVSMTGDLANWAIPGGRVMGIGGAMDLASGAKRTIAMMNHVSRDGSPKLLAECDFPLTAKGVVSRVITDLAILDPVGDGFRLVELAPGVTLDALRAATGAPILEG